MKKCVALLLTLVMLLSLMACQKTAGTTDPTQASEQPKMQRPRLERKPKFPLSHGVQRTATP